MNAFDIITEKHLLRFYISLILIFLGNINKFWHKIILWKNNDLYRIRKKKS